MKKHIFLIVLLCLAFSVSAQEFGLRAGADFASAKMKVLGESDTEGATGFYVGFFGSFDISESFAIRPELNYVGVDIEDTPFSQLTIPILAQFSTSENFHILVGPDFGFLLDTDEGLDSFNFGLDFGLAFNFSENFAIEGRYNLGLSNLVDDDIQEFTDIVDAKIKLSGFMLGLAYAF